MHSYWGWNGKKVFIIFHEFYFQMTDIYFNIHNYEQKYITTGERNVLNLITHFICCQDTPFDRSSSRFPLYCDPTILDIFPTLFWCPVGTVPLLLHCYRWSIEMTEPIMLFDAPISSQFSVTLLVFAGLFRALW